MVFLGDGAAKEKGQASGTRGGRAVRVGAAAEDGAAVSSRSAGLCWNRNLRTRAARPGRR